MSLGNASQGGGTGGIAAVLALYAQPLRPAIATPLRKSRRFMGREYYRRKYGAATADRQCQAQAKAYATCPRRMRYNRLVSLFGVTVFFCLN
jgi:hypothetical protein